jgi:hypothetical protein
MALSLLLSPAVWPSGGDMPLVISEIQKSVEKSYGVVFPNQNPMPRPPQEKSEKEQEKKVIEEEKVVIKRKGLKDPKESQDDSLGPNTKDKPLVKKLVKPNERKTPGQLKIEKQLAKNREILKKRREEYLKKRRLQKPSDDSAPVRDSGSDWLSQKKAAMDNWTEQKKRENKKWQEDRLATLKRWQEARKQFKKVLPEIKKDLTDIPFGAASVGKVKYSEASSKKDTKKNSSNKDLQGKSAQVATTGESQLELSFIEDAFRIPIRSQGTRPTCAAFAAVRAVEILAKAMGKERDLSEQYFYFASKPDCQQSPCQSPGSWPRKAFLSSQESSDFDIPLEKSCPYNDKKKAGNETQIPLKRSCRQGVAKVESFSMIKDRLEIHHRLRQGQPIIGGFRLSEDFFLNTGYVFKEKGQNVGKREHAQGHAILLVGVMELPKALYKTQGRYCTLIANSWGEGWGRGGHACISDAWFDEFRYDIPFIALEKVAIR